MKNLTLNSTLLKGLIMTLITLAATMIYTTGIPSTLVQWLVMLITLLGTIFVYLGQNIVFPATSAIGTINIWDVFKGVLIALGSGLSQWVADKATSTAIDWNSLGHAVVFVICGYFIKQFGTPIGAIAVK